AVFGARLRHERVIVPTLDECCARPVSLLARQVGLHGSARDSEGALVKSRLLARLVDPSRARQASERVEAEAAHVADAQVRDQRLGVPERKSAIDPELQIIAALGLTAFEAEPQAPLDCDEEMRGARGEGRLAGKQPRLKSPRDTE